tara:strand:- start:874 stop:1011 length:138 start_codon:yes stop_codon:yes gene_type:complete
MIKKIVEYIENIIMDIYMGYVTEHEQLALIGLFVFILSVMVFILA